MTGKTHIDRAARIVRAGGIVAYPTEAVFGLGCLPENRLAVERLRTLKAREAQKGFILIAADFAALDGLVVLPPGQRGRDVLASWPGPVTWVLEAGPDAPKWLAAGRGTLAVRVTAHVVAAALCRRARSALISTSANVSRRPPHTRLLTLRREFGACVDYVLAGALGDAPRPTAIRDGATGRTLRAG